MYFYFSTIDKKEIVCQINKLKSKQSTQDTDILVQIWEQIADFSAEYIKLATGSSKFVKILLR